MSIIPKTLCIDEFHANSGFYSKRRKKWFKDDYNVNITDWERRVVVDVLQQKTLAFLSKHFRHHYHKYARENVRFFVCDMNGSFISLAKECFPKALICIDNFHVIQRLSKAVTDVRRRLQNAYKDNNDTDSYNLMKHLQYPLLICGIKFYDQYGDKAEEKFQRLESAFEIAPELEEVYKAYQDFLEILMADDFKYQRESLSSWIQEYSYTYVSELFTAVNTIKLYRSYILNAWQYNRSNGPCEGLNKKIKDVKRSMYGAHSFENLRKHILQTCGNVDIKSPMLVIHYDIKKEVHPLITN